MFGMVQMQQECPVCHGEGTVIKNKCKHCAGQGTVQGEEVVEINIPAGVADGMVVNCPGKGNAAPHNGIAGDIQVIIAEEPNSTFVRSEQDLIYNLLISVDQAILGDTVEVPLINGHKARIKIEPGTQPGKVLRLADIAYGDEFDHETLKKWLRSYCRRLFSQQFKRSCLQDGPTLVGFSLSPRTGFLMPSDGSNALYLQNVDELD